MGIRLSFNNKEPEEHNPKEQNFRPTHGIHLRNIRNGVERFSKAFNIERKHVLFFSKYIFKNHLFQKLLEIKSPVKDEILLMIRLYGIE
jgi:hypothetical protein